MNIQNAYKSVIARMNASVGPTPPAGGTFSFQIVTTGSPQTFTLPLGTSGDYAQDFTIEWGMKIPVLLLLMMILIRRMNMPQQERMIV